jgi:Fic family protein
VVKAGLAHLWFVTIHPFDDGNGRIARAVGDMALAQVLAKARFWQHWAGVPMNDRQIKLLNKLLDGFEGKRSAGFSKNQQPVAAAPVMS